MVDCCSSAAKLCFQFHKLCILYHHHIPTLYCILRADCSFHMRIWMQLIHIDDIFTLTGDQKQQRVMSLMFAAKHISDVHPFCQCVDTDVHTDFLTNSCSLSLRASWSVLTFMKLTNLQHSCHALWLPWDHSIFHVLISTRHIAWWSHWICFRNGPGISD